MTKLENVCCAVTWGIMTSLLIALTFDPTGSTKAAPPSQHAGTSTAPLA